MNLGIDGLSEIEPIGRGGFGAVYRAFDAVHGRDVAVKVLPVALDESTRRQFDRERRAMGKASGHPNIATVFTSGLTDAGEPYLVMELLTGGSIADRIASGPMSVDDSIRCGAALADALAVAHRAGVLHLDVKPENVLISEFGSPKLVDFGIAALADDEHITGTIRATPAYAAPEVLDGRPASEASDVYSLAATMFAMLTGAPPYRSGDSPFTVVRSVALDPVPVLDRPDAPDELVRLLERAMHKAPDGRPRTMAEFGRELRQLADALGLLGTPAHGVPVITSGRRDTTIITGPTPPIAPPAATGPGAAGRTSGRRLLIGAAVMGVLGVGGVAAALGLLAPNGGSGQNGASSISTLPTSESTPTPPVEPSTTTTSTTTSTSTTTTTPTSTTALASEIVPVATEPPETTAPVPATTTTAPRSDSSGTTNTTTAVTAAPPPEPPPEPPPDTTADPVPPPEATTTTASTTTTQPPTTTTTNLRPVPDVLGDDVSVAQNKITQQGLNSTRTFVECQPTNQVVDYQPRNPQPPDATIVLTVCQ